MERPTYLHECPANSGRMILVATLCGCGGKHWEEDELPENLLAALERMQQRNFTSTFAFVDAQI